MARVAGGTKPPDTYKGGSAMNIGLIATFVVVLAGLVFMLYAIVRPFTHIHHDHNDVFHPPHLG
jgi:hypothetical protein